MSRSPRGSRRPVQPKQGAPAQTVRIMLVGASLLAAVAAIELTVLDRFFPRHTGPTDAAQAQNVALPPGDFDYFVLALSWSPAFCRRNPDRDQCGQGRRLTLHGLWPQYEQGWPEDCPSRFGRPSRAALRANADLTGSEGLLAYQWRKHGACSGLAPDAFFGLARQAVDAVRAPELLAELDRGGRARPAEIEAAFLRANPALEPDGVTVKCRDNRFSEVRICLAKDLSPRRCGADVVRDCGARSIALDAPR